jgi:D-glycero-D-manno-heptose 1,7-bisphosphate phosphatase
MGTPLRPALFIDRDGVLIENRDNYVRSWSDVEFLPGILDGMAQARSLPFLIIVVTNQSAVGRGHISLESAEAINRRVVAEIESAGGRIDGAYICPHAPEDACACRKPLPGMLHQAAEALAIDLSRSIMVGDALTDIMAGQAAGVGEAVLVRTGRGGMQEMLPEAADLPSFRVVDSLLDVLAAEVISRDQ